MKLEIRRAIGILLLSWAFSILPDSEFKLDLAILINKKLDDI